MNSTDYLIIAVYAVLFLMMGLWFRGQKDKQDYFLGSRHFGWFPLGLSVMATQLSTISFISAPAFAGLREGGGMQWLAYSFPVPLAMIFIMAVVIPPLYKAGIVSVYGFLEERFGKSTRLLIGGMFMIGRSMATGVMIYAVALTLHAAIAVPFWQTILLVGVITLIYSLLGGMKAVVYGDMIQMLIIFAGLLVCFWYSLDALGGWQEFVTLVDKGRLVVIETEGFGIGDEEKAHGIWPMLIGGLFLYVSYYGTDQSQAQRSLSASSLSTVRKTLFFNGIARYPMILLFCLFGLALGTLVGQDADLASLIPAEHPDYMVPVFIINRLPHGIIGLLMVAMLSAAMSSLSSAINSLSAVTVEDFIPAILPDRAQSNSRYVFNSRLAALFWGAFCILMAFGIGHIADTVIEAINKVGSVFYGPILMTFLLAILSRKTNTTAMNLGIVLGVACNLFLWIYFGKAVSWFWWNAAGAFVTGFVTLSLTKLLPAPSLAKPFRFELDKSMLYSRESILLAIYFVITLVISWYLPGWLGA